LPGAEREPPHALLALAPQAALRDEQWRRLLALVVLPAERKRAG
jgi:hypothetical protein